MFRHIRLAKKIIKKIQKLKNNPPKQPTTKNKEG